MGITQPERALPANSGLKNVHTYITCKQYNKGARHGGDVCEVLALANSGITGITHTPRTYTHNANETRNEARNEALRADR